jgi:plasmid stabilization system protein ParE
MKRYVVIFEDIAQSDLRASYDWGCGLWGKREAQRWLRELRTAVVEQLEVVPEHFHWRLKTINSLRKSAKWLSDVTACYLRSRVETYTCFMFEGHTEHLLRNRIDHPAS